MKQSYLDYNVYEGLAKERLHLPEKYRQHSKIYLSITHAKEFSNAVAKNNSEKNLVYIKGIMNLFDRDWNNANILNPSSIKMLDESKTFLEVSEKVYNVDNNKTIEKEAKVIYKNQTAIFNSLRTKDKSITNNSNLSSKKIWERPEVINALGKFQEEIFKAPEKIYVKPFELKQNIFKGKQPDFYQLKLSIEFLQNVLSSCGYNRDKDERKVKSGIYDTEHAINAAYCDYFVTEDEKLAKRLNAIYYFLGLKTVCLSFEEWCKKLQEEIL